MELRTPFVARMQIDKELGVVETAGVTAVVGAANLTDDLPDFRKTPRA
jgi:hypothetical protein